MTTSPLIIPVARFFSISGGAALAGGKVYTYEAGTDTPKASYTDFEGLTPNTNPVILDSSGQADIWLDGNYKINLTDANDVQQPNYPVDNVFSISTGSATEYAVTTGSANNYVLAPAPAIVAYTPGVAFNIKINTDNTGPSTINVSALGAQAIVVSPSYPLAGGELIAGNVYRIVYDGTNFQLLNPTPPIDIIMSASATAPWGRLPMNASTIAMTSGATYNDSIYSRVYAYLWNNYSDSVAPVSTGRGASAAADFAANKTITIPDMRDYVALGVSAAGSITAPGATAGASTQAAAGTIGNTGSTSVTTAQLASHPHVLPGWVGGVGSTGSYTARPYFSSLGDAPTGVLATDPSTNSAGSGSSHNHTGGTFTGTPTSVVQKSFGVYWYISY